METDKKRGPGAPSIYTPELAAEILRRLANGESLRSISRDESMPAYVTMNDWVIQDREGFAAQYARARDRGLDAMADDILDISDHTQAGVITSFDPVNGETKTTKDMTDHRKLRIDARKWYLSKLAPKKYGDRLNLDHSGSLTVGERLRAGRKRAGKE